MAWRGSPQLTFAPTAEPTACSQPSPVFHLTTHSTSHATANDAALRVQALKVDRNQQLLKLIFGSSQRAGCI